MSFWAYSLFAAGIVILWIITKRYEWKLPRSFVQTIENVRDRILEEDTVKTLHLTIEAIEFQHEDIEKEIYIRRKARQRETPGILMDVQIQATHDQLEDFELMKTKERLEKRFPGVTVNFCPEREDQGNVILCGEGP